MPELVELIRKRDFNQLREILCGFPAQDLAEIFTDLKPDDEAVLLRILPRDLAAELLEDLPVEDQEKMLQALGSEQVAQILNDISADDRTALLEELPAAARPSLAQPMKPRLVSTPKTLPFSILMPLTSQFWIMSTPRKSAPRA